MAERRVSFIVGANIRNFQNKMQNVSKSFKNVGRKAERAGNNISKRLTAPLIALGTGLIALQKSTGNYADELLDLAQITGVNTDALQEWRNVAREAGVESDAFANAVSGLSRRMRGIGEESGAAFDAAEKLGVSFKDSTGQIRDTDEAMTETIAALSKMEPGLERAALAGDLFGRRWEQIAPILGMTSDEIAHARSQAHDLGMVMDGESLEAANRFRQGFERLRERIKSIGREIAVVFLPIMESEFIPMVEAGVSKLREFAKSFTNLDKETQKTYVTIGLVAAAIGPLLIAFGKLFKVIAALLSPLAIKIGLFAALAAGFMYVVRNADVFQERIKYIMNQAVRFVAEGVSGALNWLGRLASATGQTQLALSLNTMGAAAKAFADDVDLEKPKLEFQSFGEFVESVKNDVSRGLDFLTEKLFQFGNDTEEVFDRVNSMSIGRATIPSPQIETPNFEKIESQWGGFSKWLRDRSENVKESAQVMGQALQSVVSSSITNFAESLGDAFTGDAGASGFFNNILLIVADFGKQLGRMLVAAGVAALGFQNLITNPIGAIAAGGALIVASTAVSNLLKKGPGKETSVNDALIRSDGSIVKFHPDDNILAMKDFSNLMPDPSSQPTIPSTGFTGGRQYAMINVNMDSRTVDRQLVELNYQRGR